MFLETFDELSKIYIELLNKYINRLLIKNEKLKLNFYIYKLKSDELI